MESKDQSTWESPELWRSNIYDRYLWLFMMTPDNIFHLMSINRAKRNLLGKRDSLVGFDPWESGLTESNLPRNWTILINSTPKIPIFCLILINQNRFEDPRG